MPDIVACEGSIICSDYVTYDQRWCMPAGRWCKHACSQRCKGRAEASTPDPEVAAEIKALREALEPFAKAADIADERMIGRFGEAVLPPETSFAIGLNLTLGHLQEARAALKDHRKVQQT